MTLLRKLQFKSHYMGTKENDLFFSSFSKKKLPFLCKEYLYLYEKLLQENDIDLTQWLMGIKEFPKSYKALASHLKNHYKALLKKQT
jgi:antitoxin CptB